jgi:hypothetical protein
MPGQTFRVSLRGTQPIKGGLQAKKLCKSKTLKVGRGERRSVLKRSEIGKKIPTS